MAGLLRRLPECNAVMGGGLPAATMPQRDGELHSFSSSESGAPSRGHAPKYRAHLEAASAASLQDFWIVLLVDLAGSCWILMDLDL